MNFNSKKALNLRVKTQPSKWRKKLGLFLVAALLAAPSSAWAGPKAYEFTPTTQEAVLSALAATAVEQGWTVENIDRPTGIVSIVAGAYNVTVLVRPAGETTVRVTINKKQVRLAFRGVRGVEKKLSQGIAELTTSTLSEVSK